MKIKTPINRDTLRQHLTYSAWKYALVAVIAIFGWSLVYTMSAYRSPEDKRIDVYIMSSTTTSEVADAFLKPVWKECVPEMETVSSVMLTNTEEYYVVQQLTVYMAAGEGDIYFLDDKYFKMYAAQGCFLPLDDLIADGVINTDGVDLAAGTVTYIAETDDDFNPTVTEQHIYGIPLKEFYGFMTGMNIDNRELYACITVNNKNDENVVPFFAAMLDAGRGEMPEQLR